MSDFLFKTPVEILPLAHQPGLAGLQNVVRSKWWNDKRLNMQVPAVVWRHVTSAALSVMWGLTCRLLQLQQRFDSGGRRLWLPAGHLLINDSGAGLHRHFLLCPILLPCGHHVDYRCRFWGIDRPQVDVILRKVFRTAGWYYDLWGKKTGVPWALPWGTSPGSSFEDPSWFGAWPCAPSADRVTCCSVSVTSWRVCSLTTAVWKTGLGLMRTWN